MALSMDYCIENGAAGTSFTVQREVDGEFKVSISKPSSTEKWGQDNITIEIARERLVELHKVLALMLSLPINLGQE